MIDSNRLKAWIESHADVCLDLIRMYLGVGLLVKGLYFMTQTQDLINMTDQLGSLFAPTAIAHYVIAAHVVGGFFLLIGLLTRVAALVQIPALLGAVFYVHMPETMHFGP